MDLQTSLLAEEGVVSCQVQVEGTLTKGGGGGGGGAVMPDPVCTLTPGGFGEVDPL